MNNKERELWIQNDEGLYRWWKSTRMSMTAFIKENRNEIDEAINRVLNPKKSRTFWGYNGY
jgi:hypothetical protein